MLSTSCASGNYITSPKRTSSFFFFSLLASLAQLLAVHSDISITPWQIVRQGLSRVLGTKEREATLMNPLVPCALPAFVFPFISLCLCSFKVNNNCNAQMRLYHICHHVQRKSLEIKPRGQDSPAKRIIWALGPICFL
jgi:hypothetical protein